MSLLEAQEAIHARLSHGGSLGDVQREIIDASPWGEDLKAALWLYAAAQPEVLRSTTPLGLRRPREAQDA
jgi:hypothetical protein